MLLAWEKVFFCYNVKLKYSEIKVTIRTDLVREWSLERRLSSLSFRTLNLLRDVLEIVRVESLLLSHVDIWNTEHWSVFFLSHLRTWNFFDITNDVGNPLVSVDRIFVIADRTLRRLWLVGLFHLFLGLLLLRLFLELLELLVSA